jgi:hypothetical protein
VLGRDGHDFADRRLEAPGGGTQNGGFAADDLDRIVIEVLVGDEQHMRLDILDGRVIELDAAPGQR